MAELLVVTRPSAEAAGRDPDTIRVTADAHRHLSLAPVLRYRDMGGSRVVVAPSADHPPGLDGGPADLHKSIISKLV